MTDDNIIDTELLATVSGGFGEARWAPGGYSTTGETGRRTYYGSGGAVRLIVQPLVKPITASD